MAVLCLWGLAVLANPARAFQLESDTVVLNDTFATPSFVSVAFRQTYATVPVVLVLPTDQGADPAALRVRNLTTTGFEVTQVEPSGVDGPHVSMTIDYVAIEPGVHTLPDGTVLEAGTLDTATIQAGFAATTGWDSVGFTTTFPSTPAVIAHLQSMNNESSNPPGTPSVPFLATAVRNVTTSGFETAIERAESTSGSVSVTETIGYLAIAGNVTGSFTDNGGNSIDYEGLATPDNIVGWDNGCTSNSFSGTYGSAPLVIAAMNRRDGNNGGWLRRCSLSASAVGLTVDEDNDSDSERAHTAEAAGVIAFSQAFDADFGGTGAFAWYRLDEASYDGTPGEVIDSSGNGNAGNTVGRVDNEDPAQVCAGAAPRGNNNIGQFDAIDTGVDVDADLGNEGSINFYYRSDRDWDRARDQMLFDASTTTNNRYFYLSLHSSQNNQGAILTFGLEDSSDGDHEVNTARLDFPRDTWVHIGVTWDLVGEELQIFVNGALQASNTFNGTGQIAGLDTLYVGDNRSSYIVVDMNGRAAEGGFDEVRLYGQVIGASQMAADRDATHPCPGAGPDHYSISHSGTAVTCGEEAVTISAHNPGHQLLDPGTPIVSLSTSTGEGTWARVLAGSGTLSDPTAGDGQATYSFPGGESSVTLAFNYTTVAAASPPEVVSLNAQDGSGVSELSGNADASDDPDLLVSRSEFRITDGSGNPVSVPEQIAGKPSDVAPGAVTLALQAVRASDSDPSVCEPFFPGGGDVDVELGGECSDPSSCAGRSLAITNNGNTTAVATSDDNGGSGAAGYTPVTLRFGPNAEAPLVLEYDDAGEIQLHARYNPIDDGSGTPPIVDYVVTGGSTMFVVRPFGFDVSVAGDDNTTGAGGTVLAVAGDDVDTTVRAVLWQAGDDIDDDGVPDAGADLSDNGATPNFGNEVAPETVTLAPTVAAPAGGSDGALSSALFSSFANGVETHGVSWDEVGHVHMDAALTDNSYLGGSDASGRADTVGRFIPADFLVTVADDGDMEVTCSATFSYTGQPFGYATGMEPQLTITARNRAGGTTTNYRSAYAKMVAGDVTVDAPSADNAQLGRDGVTPVSISATINTGGLVANGNGTLTYTLDSGDVFSYDKIDNARIDPFMPAFDLDVSAVDDGEASAATPLPTAQPAATHQMRFGRLAVDGAIGSELAPIDQAVRAEYWQNDTWQTHADDDCTTLALAGEVQLDNDQGGPVNGTQPLPVGAGSTDLTTNTADPVALAAGRAVLTFAASGDGNTGFAETTLTLTANRPWLRHDWDDADGAGDGPYDDLPGGRVTFGIHAGNPNWIHFRRTQ